MPAFSLALPRPVRWHWLALAWVWLFALACNPRPAANSEAPAVAAEASGGLNVRTSAKKGVTSMKRSYKKPSDDELRKRLSPLQFEVARNDATEPPFRNEFWDNHQEGLYVDIVSDEPLFSSRDKFESGTGWPSFSRPVEAERVIKHVDRAQGMVRTEVRSKDGDSHLGHVFEDGPAPTGLRYCINSASLRFIPVAKLEAEGYGEYRSLFAGAAPAPKRADDNSCTPSAEGQSAGCATTLETVVLAGGCFWGMQDLLRKIPGVLETEVGYTGGATKSPTYEDVHLGSTGHAEAVRLVFDPKKLSFDELLEKWFFRMHDPTTKDRQGNDRGTQYRSAIFVTSPEQRKVAEAVKARVDQSGKWRSPVVTQIVEAGTFTLAEGYHQDYLVKNPGGYSCHFMRE